MFRTIDAGSYNLSFLYSPRRRVASESNGIGVFLGLFDNIIEEITGTGGTTTSWMQVDTQFTVTGPTILGFRALGISDSVGGLVDNISLSTVPEPASWTMMIAGFGLVGATMRRGRKIITRFSDAG